MSGWDQETKTEFIAYLNDNSISNTKFNKYATIDTILDPILYIKSLGIKETVEYTTSQLNINISGHLTITLENHTREDMDMKSKVSLGNLDNEIIYNTDSDHVLNVFYWNVIFEGLPSCLCLQYNKDGAPILTLGFF